MSAQLTGRTALVTGGDRGIGAAVVHRLATAGALVAVHYATEKDLAAAVVEQIRSNGGAAFTVGGDLSTGSGVDGLQSAVRSGLIERRGTDRLDILVNNAAMAMPAPVPFESLPATLFDQMMAVNARAPMMLLQSLLPVIPAGGRVINMSSGLTRFANPGEMVHAMSKAALEMLALHLAKPLAQQGITINTVAPGVTDNGSPAYQDPALRTVLGRLSAFDRIAEPDDIAGIVAFLAGPDSGWLTGTWTDATGGTLLGGLGPAPA